MGFFQRLKDATIGFSGYARLGRSRWAFGFMTLVLLISMAVGVARWTKEVREFGQVAAQELASGPDWGLVDGEFHYDGPMPAFPAENIVIDTTGKYDPEQLRTMRQGILITQDRMYNWNSPRMQELDLAEIPFTFTRADMSALVQGIYGFVPVLGILTFLFQLGFKAFDAVILAWIGQLAVKVNGRPAPFGQAYQIALYAMTIPIIIQWIFGLSSFSMGFFIWWGVGVLYT
ncbi:MAG TPA: DUF1189 domain-containing protein, partial [Symbiobacteriaceae bacterium]|nr:DUF1189 domain-containing protein [Symbiobacteriaceae bacterium]